MKRMFGIILSLFLSFQSYASDNAQETVVLELQHRLAQDIVSAITPFLEKGAKIKTLDNRIILESSPNNIATIKSLVKQFDIAPQKLLISVSNGHDKPNEVMSVDSAGQVSFGSQNLGGRSVNYGTSRESQRQVNHIRVDNGQVAFISTGVTIPLIQSQFAASDIYRGKFNANGNLNGAGALGGSLQGAFVANGVATENAFAGGQSYDYKNLSNGIYVRPQVVGKQVQLDLLTHNDQPLSSFQDTTQATYTTFKSETTLMIPTEQWINFGGNQTQDETTTDYSYRTQDKSQTQRTLWLRVDIIPEPSNQ